jgi:hypothetical protein
MEAGNIREFDSPAKLMEDKNSLFPKLVRVQLCNSRPDENLVSVTVCPLSSTVVSMNMQSGHCGEGSVRGQTLARRSYAVLYTVQCSFFWQS